MKMLWAGMRPLGSIPVLRGLGVLKPGRDEVRLTLKLKDGQAVERVLAPVAQEQERKLGPPPVASRPSSCGLSREPTGWSRCRRAMRCSCR
jgi:hypothetical protein